MIFRHARALTVEDNVRLNDHLWNIAHVSIGAKSVKVILRRSVGDEMTLDLEPNDLVLVDY